VRGVPKPKRPTPKNRPSPDSGPRLTPDEWFVSRGWAPFAFQREAWGAYRAGESGLIHAATGTGKTYAAYLGPLFEAVDEPRDGGPAPVRVLWVTPLRALAGDTARSLESPLQHLGLPWDVGTRTGDTTSSVRARQQKRLPTVFVTTPESLSLILTYPDARARFAGLRCVVCDEWHELLGSKRGVLTELAVARLRSFLPRLRVWGVSATLGNVDEALAALVGPGRGGRVIRGHVPKSVTIDAAIPDRIDRFPWAGHLGLALLPRVVAAIEESRSTLVFTNTRAQCETWYQSLLAARPDWAGHMALHHGSLDRTKREWVEGQLREGALRCVVCTSTLDLGVDFAPVDRVVQIGTPKGVARLLQRAGRSGHQPGVPSRVTCVPTNALELLEIAAARTAASRGQIERRVPISRPLDVLAQHAVSSALAGGFHATDLFAEVRTTHAFRDLSAEEWHWVLDFVTRGGEALRAYPEFRRVVCEGDVYTVPDVKLARRHRTSIGTIVGDAAVEVRFVRGGRLGTVEESFAARLRPGDRFAFAGRFLEFVRIHQMTIQVRRTNAKPSRTPRWTGGRLALSGELAAVVRERLGDAARGVFDGPEMAAVRPLLDVQSRWSHVPGPDEWLLERVATRGGHHLFLYPFEGRLVHEGLAALFAYRLTRHRTQTFSLAANDYGFELASPDPILRDPDDLRDLLRDDGLDEEILATANAGELTKRHFREIARVAGLVNPGLPHAGRTAKSLQASSGLFYDVFREYDPGNLLLRQARRDVLDRPFEATRLRRTLARLRQCRVMVTDPPHVTPLAFPLFVDRMRDSVSSETLAARVRRMAVALERKAGPRP
jgi:ATP-dependent Lhr-like helicase